MQLVLMFVANIYSQSSVCVSAWLFVGIHHNKYIILMPRLHKTTTVWADIMSDPDDDCIDKPA